MKTTLKAGPLRTINLTELARAAASKAACTGALYLLSLLNEASFHRGLRPLSPPSAFPVVLRMPSNRGNARGFPEKEKARKDPGHQ